MNHSIFVLMALFFAALIGFTSGCATNYCSYEGTCVACSTYCSSLCQEAGGLCATTCLNNGGSSSCSSLTCWAIRSKTFPSMSDAFKLIYLTNLSYHNLYLKILKILPSCYSFLNHSLLFLPKLSPTIPS